MRAKAIRGLRAVALAACVASLAACGAERGRPASAPSAATAGPASAGGVALARSPEPPFAVAPDPSLQRLIDPAPCGADLCWLGADVATSIELASDRFVWLFGDTLLGRVRRDCAGRACETRRSLASDPAAMLVRNSVGVLERAPDRGDAPIVKYWRTERGHPAPIFDARVPGAFLWPMSGARVGRVLLIAANRHTPESGLAPTGNVFVRVWNPDAPPDRWSYTLHEIPHARTGVDQALPLTWTAAMAIDGDFVYLLGELGAGLEARAVLARLPRRGIERRRWRPRPEYLTSGGAGGEPFFTPEFRLDALQTLPGLPGTSEASLDRDPRFGWLTFEIAPLDFDVRAFAARDPAGPWSDLGVVYRIPPPWSALPRVHCRFPEIACGQDHYAAYAVKSHPELAPPRGLALSYNVNLLFGDLEATEAELDGVGFYVPQMLAGAPIP